MTYLYVYTLLYFWAFCTNILNIFIFSHITKIPYSIPHQNSCILSFILRPMYEDNVPQCNSFTGGIVGLSWVSPSLSSKQLPIVLQQMLGPATHFPSSMLDFCKLDFMGLVHSDIFGICTYEQGPRSLEASGFLWLCTSSAASYNLFTHSSTIVFSPWWVKFNIGDLSRDRKSADSYALHLWPLCSLLSAAWGSFVDKSRKMH